MRKAYRILDKAADWLLSAATGGVATSLSAMAFLSAGHDAQWFREAGVAWALVLPPLGLSLLGLGCAGACCVMARRSAGAVFGPTLQTTPRGAPRCQSLRTWAPPEEPDLAPAGAGRHL